MNLQSILREHGLEAKASNLEEIPAALDHRVQVLRVVAAAFFHMQQAAAAVGVDLVPVSGFRSLERQSQIWSRKMTDAIGQMGDRQSALCTVMEYSAPPGWSRHHWGTEIDLVGGQLREEARLEADDWIAGGPCHDADQWLAAHAAKFGFHKPYDQHYGGFLAEPWHWSFVPTSGCLLPLMKRIDWKSVFAGEDFAAAELLANQVVRLFKDFVLGINPILL